MELLAVRRRVSSHEEMALRQQRDVVTHRFPRVTMRWRRVGMMNVTLLQAKEYDLAASKKQGRLKRLSKETGKSVLEQVIAQSDTASSKIEPLVTGVELLGNRRYQSVALMLAGLPLLTERTELTDCIDHLNGINFNWKDFRPHVSLGTVDAQEVDSRFCAAVHELMPARVGLRPAQPTLASR